MSIQGNRYTAGMHEVKMGNETWFSLADVSRDWIRANWDSFDHIWFKARDGEQIGAQVLFERIMTKGWYNVDEQMYLNVLMKHYKLKRNEKAPIVIDGVDN